VSQSVVTIRLNGHPYKIGCGAGEEDHVAKLGSEVEAVMQSLIASVGQIGEARLLAMVALILADRAAVPSTNKSRNDVRPVSSDITAHDDSAAEVLEDAAERIAVLASKLASGTTNS
jgi:cell division protein ZapA